MKPVDWLSSADGQLWVNYQRGTQLLERLVDQQLRTTAGLSHPEFQILARLADAPQRRLRMGTLADLLVSPKSRLNYQIGQLLARGLVAREPHPGDGRGLDAVLTDAGFEQVDRAAPGHIATVHTHLIEQLNPAERRQLATIMHRIADAATRSVERGECADEQGPRR